MRTGKILTVLAVPSAVCVLAAGFPLAAGASTGPSAPAVPPREAGYGPLTPALTRELARHPDQPVIVVLKSQPGRTGPSGLARRATAAAQQPLVSELRAVDAGDVRPFSLVDSVAATVSAAEARRLTADPAVAAVVPDATFALTSPVARTAGRRPAAAAASPKLHNIPGACAPAGKSQLAPEGLALTGTASGHSNQPTARTLGFNGGGVKVAYIADGIDPGNANFKRKNGDSAFTAVKDFSGAGPGAATGGGEAFLDANTIAGQGLKTYNVNGFSAQSYPGTCDIKIQGVAPGVSLVGLDALSDGNGPALSGTTSTLLQAINYAVSTAKVNVLNESFGTNPLPDSAWDLVKQFDDAAVKAGVVVSVSSGDSGTAGTIGSPATDPNLISVGATTQFQAYAQANLAGARYFASTGWLSDNISAISSSGYNEQGGTVDLVAPGDLSFDSCTANASQYADCANNVGEPSVIAQAGGTSEAAPFVSGAAALVIQAFRSAHHAKSPTPAQVKQILLSSATDLGVPAQEQGAGLLNTYRAVQLAKSFGTAGKRTGESVASSAGQLTSQTLPGAVKTWKVTVTNEGQSAQKLTVNGRTLAPARTSSATGTVTLSNASAHYTDPTGGRDNYTTFKFKVPAGQGRLNVATAYTAERATLGTPPTVTLFDPKGRIAATSLPQGIGNFGNTGVRAPAPGLWTAVVSSPASGGGGGYAGPVTWTESTQKFASFGSYAPSSLNLGPGKSGSFVLTVKAPPAAGDLAGSVLVHASKSGVTTIPVVVRSLVNPPGGGQFTGTLTGGNGRGGLGALASSDFYQFDVPAGTPALRAEFALQSNAGQGNPVSVYLVAPDGEVQGYGQNSDTVSEEGGTTGPALTASVAAPAVGRWTLALAFTAPTGGQATSIPFTGSVTFGAAATLVPQTPLPQGTVLVPGTPTTVPVKITNTSNAPQDYYLDPRLTTTSTVQLAPFVFGRGVPFTAGSSKTVLPATTSAPTEMYFVPTDASTVTVNQTSSVPAMTDLETIGNGDPSTGVPGLSKGSLCAKKVTESYTPAGGVLASGVWGPGPAECGPFQSPAPSGVATDQLLVTMAAFDTGVSVPTGDFERLATSPAAGSAAVGKAVALQPGQSATVDVTFEVPSGTPAGARHGLLYLDTLQGNLQPNGQLSGDQVTAQPYSYTVG